MKLTKTGKRAAESVMRYLNKESLIDGRDLKDTSSYKTKLNMPIDWSQLTIKRVDMDELDPLERIHSFDEVALGYTAEQAKKEA